MRHASEAQKGYFRVECMSDKDDRRQKVEEIERGARPEKQAEEERASE